MKEFCLLFLFVFLFTKNIAAQELVLRGKVVDHSHRPIEYMQATLYGGDSTSVRSVSTDSSGVFKLQVAKGNYRLKIQQFGKIYFNKEIILSQHTNLGEMEIDESVMLKGVVVSGRKKLVEQKIDRLVFNVENSIASQGMNGMDALRNTPLVRTDDSQGISIVGKSNVAVMINDRLLNLSGSELTNYLQSLRSDDILKIEVITTPPAKYEAQGNSGLINIVLKKNPNNGWSGTVNGSFQRNSQSGYRSGATLNYQSGKLSSSLILRKFDIGFSPTGTRDLIGEQSVYTTTDRKDRTYGFGLNYSLDYKLSEKSTIGGIYDYGNSHYDMDIRNTGIYKYQNIVDSTLNTYSESRAKTPTHTANIYYDLKIDTAGKKLSITGNYLTNTAHKINNFNTTNITSQHESIIRNTSKMDYNIYSGQADLALPYQWSKIEVGGKYTLFSNKSDVGYYDYKDQEYIINPNNSNVFDYREQNYAAYLSLQKDFNEKWSAKAGLRYEYTTLRGLNQEAGDHKISREYGRWFPSAYISYKADKDHVLSVNYSRRINRPGFQALNPFRWYSNQYTYTEGNPILQPSYNDNAELSYSFKNKLTLSVYNQHGQNNYTTIARFVDGIYSNTYENSYNENKTGLNIGYYDTFFNIWETSVNANAFYTRSTPLIPEIAGAHAYSMYYSINNTITMNSSKTVFLMLNFWHNLPWTIGNMHLGNMYEFSPGVRVSMLEKKLQGSMVVNDVFKTIKNSGYSAYSGYRENLTQYNDYRRLTLSLTYSFGSKKVKAINKDTKFDDKNRAN